MAQVPLTSRPKSSEKIREALGLGQPDPCSATGNGLYSSSGSNRRCSDRSLVPALTFAEGKQRVISWQTRSPVMDIVVQRIPQTLWVVGLSYIVGILIALPIGIYSAYQTIFGVRSSRHVHHHDRLFDPALLYRAAALIVVFS